MSKESDVETHVFKDGSAYDKFLSDEGAGSGYGSRAKGFIRHDGSIVVAIDEPFYLRAGILPDQLEAIKVHEITELLSEDRDAHEQTTIAEYAYIFQHHEKTGLVKYHSSLCNLMGGSNEIRNLALQQVLSEQS